MGRAPGGVERPSPAASLSRSARRNRYAARAFAGRLLVADEPAVAADLLTPLFEADSDRCFTARRLGEVRLRSGDLEGAASPLDRALVLRSPDAAPCRCWPPPYARSVATKPRAADLLAHVYALDPGNKAVLALRSGTGPLTGAGRTAAGSRTLPAENRLPESADAGHPVGDEGTGGVEARGGDVPEAALNACATGLVAVSDRTLLARDFRRVRVARRHQVSGHSGKQVPPHDVPQVSKQVLAQVSGQVGSQVLQQVGGQVGSHVCGWPPATSSICSSVRFAIGRFRSRSVPTSSVFPAGVGSAVGVSVFFMGGCLVSDLPVLGPPSVGERKETRYRDARRVSNAFRGVNSARRKALAGSSRAFLR